MWVRILTDLKEGRFRKTNYRFDDFGSFTTYKTDSGDEITVGISPFGKVIWVNAREINFFRRIQISRAIKKGTK